jgi:hypothetical protein
MHAIGLSRNTIFAGMRELQEQARREFEEVACVPIRQPGSGRKRADESDPTILKDLNSLAESTSRGGPQSPLCWTGKSERKLPK